MVQHICDCCKEPIDDRTPKEHIRSINFITSYMGPTGAAVSFTAEHICIKCQSKIADYIPSLNKQTTKQ